jgi:hypothetical protein
MDDAPAQQPGGLERIVAVHQQPGRVVIDGQAAAVETGQVFLEQVGPVDAGFQGQRDAGAVAVPAQGGQSLGHAFVCGVLVILDDLAGMEKDQSWPEVEAEAHHLAYVVDACFLVFEGVQSVAQGAAQGGQFEVVRAQQMTQLAPPRVGKFLRSQLPGRVQLNSRNAKLLGLEKGTLERQAQGLHTDADLDRFHRVP